MATPETSKNKRTMTLALFSRLASRLTSFLPRFCILYMIFDSLFRAQSWFAVVNKFLHAAHHQATWRQQLQTSSHVTSQTGLLNYQWVGLLGRMKQFDIGLVRQISSPPLPSSSLLLLSLLFFPLPYFISFLPFTFSSPSLPLEVGH